MPTEGPHDSEYIQIFQEHNKSLSRMAWKNMDCEEFNEGFLGLLKSLAKVTKKIRKSDLKRSLQRAKLNLTAAEGDLLVTKLFGSISFTRKKLRDAGSGKRLPPSCQTIRNIWGRRRAEKKKSNPRTLGMFLDWQSLSPKAPLAALTSHHLLNMAILQLHLALPQVLHVPKWGLHQVEVVP